MERITIDIKGSGASCVAAKLMRAIYKTMALIDASKCYVDIHSESAKAEYEEVSIPEFMQEASRPIERLSDRIGERRRTWQ